MSQEDWSNHDEKAKELAEESFSWEQTDSDTSFTQEEKKKLSMMAPEEEYQPTYTTEENR